jgi:hypothetical protein
LNDRRCVPLRIGRDGGGSGHSRNVFMGAGVSDLL